MRTASTGHTIPSEAKAKSYLASAVNDLLAVGRSVAAAVPALCQSSAGACSQHAAVREWWRRHAHLEHPAAGHGEHVQREWSSLHPRPGDRETSAHHQKCLLNHRQVRVLPMEPSPVD